MTSQIGEMTIVIKSEPQINYHDRSEGVSAVAIAEHVEVRLKNPVSVTTALRQIVNPLRDFMSLATTMPNSLVEFFAEVQNDPADESLRRIALYTEVPYSRTNHVNLFNQRIMFFNAKDIVDHSPSALTRWFHIYDEIRDVCELFFGVHYDQSAFPTNRFLNVVQAMESYHRVRRGKHALPPASHKRRVMDVLQGAPNEHRDWLAVMLQHNEKPLKMRVEELVDEAGSVFRLFAADGSTFARWVVDSRNFYTHREDQRKRKVARGNDLELLTRSLLWLLRIHFLSEIGFSKHAREELLNKNFAFCDVRDVVVRTAPWIRTKRSTS